MEAKTLKPVAIIGGQRIPFCRSNTAYSDASNRDMGVKVLGATVEKYKLHGKTLGEVAFGAVTTHSRDWNLAREVTLSSGLSPYTPGITLQRACGTSLDAAIVVANKIATGQIEAGIGGGSDTTSDAPIVFSDRFAKRLLKASAARSAMDRFKAFKGLRPADLAPKPPANGEPRTGLSMGQHCDLMAHEWGISREAQDQLAYESHTKLAAAYESGFMDDLIVPFRGVARDNNMRPDTTLEKLASLKPARPFINDHQRGTTLSPGNSTPLTDGASAALLASDAWAKANKLKPMAYLTHAKVAANDFVAGEGLLMAPTYAVAQLLTETGLSFGDFDLFEIHEAFAAQVLCTLRAWESKEYCTEKLGLKKALGEIDPAKLNVMGSSLAAGHPFAATGTRILPVAAKLLQKKRKKRALISICTAGGMGVAAIVERP